jgi:hypothetical protein
LFYCEHLESVHGGVEVGALDHKETCAQVFERYNGVWIEYLGGDRVELQGYTYLDLEGSAVDKKRTSGSCFSLGSTMISCFNRKHNSVPLSSIETEYMVAIMVRYEAIWLHKLLTCLLY